MEIWEEPVRGGYPPPWTLALTGPDRFERFVEVSPYPPIGHFLGVRPVERDGSWATALMPVSPWLVSPQGRVPLGALAIVADLAFGLALGEQLPAGVGFTTAELSLTRVREPALHGELEARGTLIHSSSQMGLTGVQVFDAEQQLVAAGTSRLSVFPPLPDLPPIPDPIVPIERPTYDTPDPWERQPAGDVLDPAVWSSLSGLEVLQAQANGDLPRPPIGRLTGLWVTEAAEGTATLTMPATAWMSTPAQTVQGGFTAMIADAALACAIQTHVARGDSFRPVDVKVNYLRPVFPDGRRLTAVGTVTHRGRSLAIAHATVTNADGKPVAVATGSAVLGDLPE